MHTTSGHDNDDGENDAVFENEYKRNDDENANGDDDESNKVIMMLSTGSASTFSCLKRRIHNFPHSHN